MPKTVQGKAVPDYEKDCEICGQTPCVTIEDVDGVVVHLTNMCGVCTFGEAACINPNNW